MELKEITTLCYAQFNGLAPFCLSSTNKHEFCVSAKQSAQVVQLQCSLVDEDNLKCFLTEFPPPAVVPTAELCESAKKLYNDSSDLQKQELCLDASLLPDIAPLPLNNSFISTKWSPDSETSDPHPSYLAGLTNFGGCVINIKSVAHRQWNVEVADLSSMWLAHCRKKAIIEKLNLLKFRDYHAFVQNVLITAFDWNNVEMHSSYGILCVTASGRLIVFDVAPNFQKSSPYPAVVSMQYIGKIRQPNVNVVKWFSWESQSSAPILQSCICTGDDMGNVIIFRIDFDSDNRYVVGVERKLDLWKYDDRLKVGDIQIEYDADSGLLVVVLCKGSYCIAFLVKDFEMSAVITHFVDGLFITGLCRIAPLTYVICTLDGTIQRLSIDLTAQLIHADDIKNNLNTTKYSLNGITVTKNQAIWMFALHPKVPIDHLVLRHPLCLSICAPPINNILNTIHSNEESTLRSFHDCAEILRVIELKNESIPDTEFQSFELPIDFESNAFIYKLKVRLVLLTARAGFLRRKSRMQALAELNAEFELINSTVLALTYFNRLKTAFHNMNANKTLSHFQILSAKCWRIFLVNYVATDVPPKHYDMYEALKPSLLEICEKTEFLEATAPEICVYCNDFIENNKLTCKDHHAVVRCCVSMVQVPIINYRLCRYCQAVALDNIEDLQEATNTKDHVFNCPVCDIPLEIQETGDP